MRKYLVGLWGSFLYLLGILFLISSLDLFKNKFWGLFFLILGSLFWFGDLLNLYLYIKKLDEKEKNFYLLIIFNIFIFIFYLIYWFIEIPIVKQENRLLLSNIKTFLLLLFILILFSSFALRIIIGYELYNLLIDRSFKHLEVKKILFQFIAFVVFFIFINLYFYQYDIYFDLSPGYYSFSKEAKKMISGIKDQDIKVFVFLPDQQLVRTKKDTTVSKLFSFSEELKIMFASLPKINPSIEVEFYNADLIDINNQAFGNVANGTIIIRNFKAGLSNVPYLERRVYVFSEFDLEKLEQNFVQALVQLSGNPIKVYFSTQNGERYTSFQNKPFDIDFFIQILRLYNFEIYEWNVSSGFPFRVPEDANILVFAGPSNPISKEAQKSILEFIYNKKGKLLIFVDSKSIENFNWLLSELKIPYVFTKSTLMQVENRPNFIYTDQIGVFDITKNVRTKENIKFLLYGGGYFAKNSDIKSEYSVNEFLYTPYTTWEEKNMNLRKDKEETNQKYIMGLELQKSESKIVLYSDVEWISNRFMIQNLYNLNIYLATDSLFYLADKMNIPGILEEKRETQTVVIDSDAKTRIIFLGVVGIPLSMILITSLAIYFYKRKYTIQSNL